MEQVVYDRQSGQNLTGSFMDYCMRRADTMPYMEITSIPVPTKRNPLRARGAGEAGTSARWRRSSTPSSMPSRRWGSKASTCRRPASASGRRSGMLCLTRQGKLELQRNFWLGAQKPACRPPGQPAPLWRRAGMPKGQDIVA
jgi:hypothetical protein